MHAPNAFGEEVTGSTPVFSTIFKAREGFCFMFTVYIIYSAKLDRYYTGYSEDIIKRLQEHNSGLSFFTSKADDWVLKYQKVYPSRQEAQG